MNRSLNSTAKTNPSNQFQPTKSENNYDICNNEPEGAKRAADNPAEKNKKQNTQTTTNSIDTLRNSILLWDKPLITTDYNNRGYDRIGDSKHHSLIDTHINRCYCAFALINTKSEIWPAIATRIIPRKNTLHTARQLLTDTPQTIGE